MPNVFDQFDKAAAPPAPAANPFDKFDSATPAPATPPSNRDAFLGRQFGTPEAILNMATGLIAKPISDVAGLGATVKEMISPTEDGYGDPTGFKEHVQQALTYEPRTSDGKMVAKYNPLALAGRGIDWVGQKAENLIAPKGESGIVRTAIGSGVHEAINQAPQFLGVKGAKPVAAGAEAALKTGAQDMMQSALKPSAESMRIGKGQQAIDTMLDEGLNVSKGGVEKMRSRIEDLNTRIANLIQNSPLVIAKSDVAAKLQAVTDRFLKQVNATDDLAAIQKAHDEFMNHPLLANTSYVAVPLAQEMKQGTYRSIKDKAYGEEKAASVEAQKALAYGLKEEIASAIPEVRALNAEESKLINALSVSERRVIMEANKNPVGLGWLTTKPTHFAAWMADRSPLFKSLVARMLNQSSEIAGGSAPAIAAGGIGVSQGAQDADLEQALRPQFVKGLGQ